VDPMQILVRIQTPPKQDSVIFYFLKKINKFITETNTSRLLFLKKNCDIDPGDRLSADSGPKHGCRAKVLFYLTTASVTFYEDNMLPFILIYSLLCSTCPVDLDTFMSI
jgi:hypothetical protein